jgi:transposase
VYLCREAVDFRKGINGLSVLVQQHLGLDPFAAQVVVFRNRRCDALKLLYWERDGFCLWQKRLERGRFRWPGGGEGERIEIGVAELQWLLTGLDIGTLRTPKKLSYSAVY